MASLQEGIQQRAEGRCEYCQIAAASTVLPHEVDHIRAQKHRGPTDLENLCLACSLCNAFKGPNVAGYDPDTDKLTRLYDPRADVWSEHLEWVGPILVGKTAVGRTTIDVLAINRAERIEHRRLLMRLGEFFG